MKELTIKIVFSSNCCQNMFLPSVFYEVEVGNHFIFLSFSITLPTGMAAIVDSVKPIDVAATASINKTLTLLGFRVVKIFLCVSITHPRFRR